MRKLIKLGIAILLSVTLLGGVSTTSAEFKPPVIHIPYQELHTDIKKQIDCLADNIYFEARAEPLVGQMAIAFVTLNRVQSGQFGATICKVVKQKFNGVCQFSWWCNDTTRYQSVKRYYDWDIYDEVRKLATHVFLNYNELHDITHGAMFFHSQHVSRHMLGTTKIKQTTRIGRHIFYRTSP